MTRVVPGRYTVEGVHRGDWTVVTRSDELGWALSVAEFWGRLRGSARVVSRGGLVLAGYTRLGRFE